MILDPKQIESTATAHLAIPRSWEHKVDKSSETREFCCKTDSKLAYRNKGYK